MVNWSSIHKLWEKWASSNVGSSGEKLGLLSTKVPVILLILFSFLLLLKILLRSKSFSITHENIVIDVDEPLKAALLLNYDLRAPSRLNSVIVEQQGIHARPDELSSLLDFVRQNNFQKECFFIGTNQYLVTSVHDQWFCARCLNTSKHAGEGAIIMLNAAFLLVAMYDGLIGAASRAMVAVDQMISQLNRRNL